MIEWFTFFSKYIPDFIQGTIITLELTGVGLLVGIFLGLGAALARVYGGKWVSRLAIAYIELFRGTPLLVQLFIVYFGLPSMGIVLSRMASAFLAMGLNSGAYQAEYFRGALLAIGKEQMMAARGIGMTKIQAVRHIILPQALRLVIPAWSNEPISLLKTSAIAFLIAVPDLMTKAKAIAVQTYDPIGSYLAVAVVYLILVFILNEGLKFLERWSKIPGFELESKKP